MVFIRVCHLRPAQQPYRLTVIIMSLAVDVALISEAGVSKVKEVTPWICVR